MHFNNEHLLRTQNQPYVKNVSSNRINNKLLVLNRNSKKSQSSEIVYDHNFINYFNYLHQYQLS